jgi:hypothetical protein
MIESRDCLFGPECEMHIEVITDLKMVYYRGRYRAATAWSKIGRASGAEKPPMVEAHKIGQGEAVGRRRKTRPSLEPAT